MVKKRVWKKAWAGRLKPWHALPGQQILCIGCLEKRIGRTLVPSDFPKAPVNDPAEWDHSDRLLNCLGWLWDDDASHRQQPPVTHYDASGCDRVKTNPCR